MKINNRIIVILCVVIVAFLIALAIISHFFILNAFSDIEHKQATEDMQRVLGRLNSEAGDVATTCRVWAQRDDTYKFVGDQNPGYIQANFAKPVSFENLKINYVLFYNSSGKLVYSRGFNPEDGTTREVPEQLKTIVRNSILPGGILLGVSGRNGYSLLNGEPVVLAGYQITTSDQKDPPEGTLIMVRQLDASRINDITEQKDLDITIRQIPANADNGVFSVAELKNMEKGAILVMPVNDSVLEEATSITGIENTPTHLLVIVDTSRALYQQVLISMDYIVGAIIILALLLILIIRWPLKKYIINPILSLDTSMKAIGKSGDITRQVVVEGDDEILSLASSLNRMLEEIDKAHQQTMESESKFRTLAETSMAGIFVFRKKILYANPAAEVQTGYSREELLNMEFWEFVHPDFQDEVRSLGQEKLQGGDAPTRIEFKIIRKNGEERWIDASTIGFDYEGERALFSVRLDITRRKRIEEELRENEEKFRALTENTPDIVFSADQNSIITYISPRVEDYGFSGDELVGKSILNHVFPEDRPQVQDHFRKAMDAGHGSTTPFRILDKSQNIHWMEVNSTMITDQSGKCTGLQGILRDITERRNTLDAITLANRKLNLMYNITRHDIVNKIAILFGLIDMTKASLSPLEREQFLNEIRDTGEAIYRQIALTRDYQEVGVKSPQWNPMKDVIGRAILNFSGSGIRFVSGIENIEIYADPLIEKVIYNLTDNAVRYGKKITTILFSTRISEKGLELICEDDGIGIDTSVKEKIFERGFGNNTGLGLFLCREILAITGITIRETGESGKGARFEMTVPKGAYWFSNTPKE
jgi:PAS domain S-box-containing protein